MTDKTNSLTRVNAFCEIWGANASTNVKVVERTNESDAAMSAAEMVRPHYGNGYNTVHVTMIESGNEYISNGPGSIYQK